MNSGLDILKMKKTNDDYKKNKRPDKYYFVSFKFCDTFKFHDGMIVGINETSNREISTIKNILEDYEHIQETVPMEVLNRAIHCVLNYLKEN